MRFGNLFRSSKPDEDKSQDLIYMDEMISRGRESLQRRKDKKLDARNEEIISSVQSRVIDIHDTTPAVNDSQAELYNQEYFESDAFISQDSYIVIPDNLKMSYPFFLIGSGLKKIRLSKLLDLSQRDREQAVAMLPEGGIIITSGEFEFEIERNERIQLPNGQGSINDYIRAPYSLRIKELK